MEIETFVARGQAAQRAVDRATDDSTWLTKVDAAARAGVTTKTIERWAADGKLQQATWHRPNGPRLAVFHPGDVERLARELNPTLPPFVEPVQQTAVGEPASTQALAARAPDVPAAIATFIGLVQALVSQMSETSQTSVAPRYVDTATALAHTGIGLRDLHRERRTGTVKARRKNGRWVWRVADFAQL
jgi:hypothetical protein